jgi:hypothetical protein
MAIQKKTGGPVQFEIADRSGAALCRAPEGGGKDYSRLSNLPKARTQADRETSELSKCVARRPAMIGKTPWQCRQAQNLKGDFCHKGMD